jgi:hypothetical protein
MEKLPFGAICQMYLYQEENFLCITEILVVDV